MAHTTIKNDQDQDQNQDQNQDQQRRRTRREKVLPVKEEEKSGETCTRAI